MKLKAHKVLALPSTLEPNSIYYVKIAGTAQMKVYVTNDTGTIIPHGLESNVQLWNYIGSGRAYLDLNTWRGFLNGYGPSYHQFSQGFGSAANPSIIRQRNGVLVPYDSVCEKLLLNGYHNSTEAMEIEVALTCFETVDNTTTTNIVWEKVFAYKTNNTNGRKFEFSVMEKCPEGSEILLAFRKTSGSGTRRYFYNSFSLNCMKL